MRVDSPPAGFRLRPAKARANLVPGDGAILIEDNFKEIAGYVALAIEAAAVFVVAFGALRRLPACSR